ncbi:hypothetical protein [Streptacidiphilus sp. MAP5-3]|uniref:hypothetical protein n=1 Tax=unclassified Streptacidiphilus TaxID=2643834 RepID=UPI0035171D28
MRSKLIALTVVVCGLLALVLCQAMPGAAATQGHRPAGAVTLADDNPIPNISPAVS